MEKRGKQEEFNLWCILYKYSFGSAFTFSSLMHYNPGVRPDCITLGKIKAFVNVGAILQKTSSCMLDSQAYWFQAYE